MGVNRRRVFSLATGTLVLVGLVAPALAQTRAAKPLRITVYGGNGNIGSRIVNEALARGHSVTVVDRAVRADAADSGRPVRRVVGDVFSPADIGRNIAGQDVLVTAVAVRPTPSPTFYVDMVKSAVAAQRSQTGARKTRLLVVGGASSLTNAQGQRIIDTLPGTLPEAAGNEIRSMVDALDYLRTVTDTSWTFFSPAASIAPGTRTGKFRIGSDQLVVDAQGRSAISMEDYAVAMLDEIEDPKHVNRRFTVGY